jgi:hypothetical protein
MSNLKFQLLGRCRQVDIVLNAEPLALSDYPSYKLVIHSHPKVVGSSVQRNCRLLIENIESNSWRE